MIKYQHPQGATIVVYDDGSLAKFDKNGKATKTSATAEKLAKGHGGWVVIEGDPIDFTVLEANRETVPGGVVRIPMKFKSGLISDLPKYIADDSFVMQQKIDGIRAQIVFTRDEPGCWVRSNSGTRLKSSAAAPTVLAIEKAYESVRGPKFDYSVDGEIINGVFWAFDIISDELVKNPFLTRLKVLTEWSADQPTDVVRLLPTAVTAEEKDDLVNRVIHNNGEGFIVKGRLSRYTWGGRVDHSLKIKLVDTADCIVTAVHGTKDSISLGVNGSSGIENIGSTSTIGKGTFAVGDIVEVQYLYAGANGRLVQPTILKRRDDKTAEQCTLGQLKFVNKEVVV